MLHSVSIKEKIENIAILPRETQSVDM